MISKVFFNKSLNKKHLEIYESSYLMYLISNFINKNEGCLFNSIVKNIERFYGKHSVSCGKLRKYVESKFIERKNHFSLTRTQQDALKTIEQFKQDILIIEEMNETILHKKLSYFVSQKYARTIDGYKYLGGLLLKKENFDRDWIITGYYDLILNYDNYYAQIDQIVNFIDDAYNDLSVNYVFSNNLLREILFVNGINQIWDLKQLSADSLTLLFFLNLGNVLKSLTSLCDNFKATYKNKICSVFNTLEKKELDVLDKRNGFSTGKKMTLEETGSSYNITRERCRQIELKATNKILQKATEVSSILMNLFWTLCTQEVRYISVDKVYEFVSNEYIVRYILFLYSICEIEIVFDKNLNVLYDKNLTSLEEICNEILVIFGDVLQISEYECLNDFEKSVVNLSYRKYRNCVYIKKEITEKELIGAVLDEQFPNGYRVGSMEDYNLLKNRFEQIYGSSIEFVSSNAIVGIIDRLGYCQVDRGTYKNPKFCAVLPNEMITEITNFILDNAPTVFYSSIFEVFKKQLDKLGIKNYYYLKGLIDPHLPADFQTKRNYISLGKERLSSTEAVINFIKSFDGVFTLNDIKKRFIGVKDYTIYNILYHEFDKGLIFLSTKKFIYLDKLNIEEDTIKELKQLIEDLFVSLNTKTISARKVYAKLTLTNKELLLKLKVVEDSFSTFSIIKTLFKDAYRFSRPLISQDLDTDIGSYVLITNYVSTLDQFNVNTIKRYTNRMNIRGLYSYLEFLEDQSDNFVQISIDTMVSKKKFNISEAQLLEISKMFALAFSKFDEIDVCNFNGYGMLPKLSYRWNKYLLVGIIRSYFNNLYEIYNTGTAYDVTNFIIRRAK